MESDVIHAVDFELHFLSTGMFQMLNNGNPIPRDIFQKILRRIYPEETDVSQAMTTWAQKSVSWEDSSLQNSSSHLCNIKCVLLIKI